MKYLEGLALTAGYGALEILRRAGGRAGFRQTAPKMMMIRKVKSLDTIFFFKMG